MTTTTQDPTTVFMNVSPEKALNWLENANTNNRKVIDAKVRYLVREIKNGKWNLSHQGIAFGTDGVLLDGQHRLWAIVESNTTVRMPVTFNVSPEAIMTIDVIDKRTMADILTLAGENGHVCSGDLSTLKAMLGGYRKAPVLTPHEASRYLEFHDAAVRFAMKHLPMNAPKGLSNAQTRAVIARAWYSVDHDVLAEFCRLLMTGIIAPSASAATLVGLREYLMTTKRRRSRSEESQRYGMMQRALVAFLNNEPLKLLKPTMKEHFPISEPDQMRETA